MHRPVVIEPAPAVRPFLKWAGGKRQLLSELRRYVPREFPAYHEPFLGSGALFFDLWRSNRLHGAACQLGDANADLVGVYRALPESRTAITCRANSAKVLRSRTHARL